MSEKTKVEFLYLSEEDMIEAGVLDAGRIRNGGDRIYQSQKCR